MPRSGGSSGSRAARRGRRVPVDAAPADVDLGIARAGSAGGRAVQAASRPRRGGTAGRGAARGPSVGSSQSTQNPRWWKWSASSTSAACTRRRTATARPAPARCASARVCSNSHGYSAVSRISLVSGFAERVGTGERLRQRVVVEHLEHLAAAAGASTSSTRSRRRTGRRRSAAACRRRSAASSSGTWPPRTPSRGSGTTRAGMVPSASNAAQSTCAPAPDARARSTPASATERGGVADRAQRDDRAATAPGRRPTGPGGT